MIPGTKNIRAGKQRLYAGINANTYRLRKKKKGGGRDMYQAAADRYDTMEYKRCGRSGLKLPRIALGLWQNFGLEKTIATGGDPVPCFRPRDHTL